MQETEDSRPVPAGDREPRGGLFAALIDYLEIFVLAVCLVFLIFTFCGRLCRVEGASMRNTLHDGELLITTNLARPRPGDIVVFHQTGGRPDGLGALNEPLVKRVIARGGQTVRIRDGSVWVDGERLDEPYAVGRTFPEGVEATVPEGRLFVMGDNREHSADSRFRQIGFVDERRVLGKAVLRLKPFTVFH